MNVKLSHNNLSSFLNDVNIHKHVQSDNTVKLRLSRSDIKFVDKAISQYIKKGQYISFVDLEILKSLSGIVKRQGSHCESEKIAKLNKALKDVDKIKSKACIASENIERHNKLLKEFVQHKTNLMSTYKESLNNLNKKIDKIDITGTRISSQQKNMCLNAKSAQSKYILLRDITSSLTQKRTQIIKDEGRWGKMIERSVDNSKYYKGHSLWNNCANEAKKMMIIEKKLMQLIKYEKNSLNLIKIESAKFNIGNDYDKLKAMV